MHSTFCTNTPPMHIHCTVESSSSYLYRVICKVQRGEKQTHDAACRGGQVIVACGDKCHDKMPQLIVVTYSTSCRSCSCSN